VKHYRFDRAKPKPWAQIDAVGFDSPRFITAKDMYYQERFTSFTIETLKNNMMITNFEMYTGILFKENVGSAKLFLVEYEIE
jgi:hypothetical protein